MFYRAGDILLAIDVRAHYTSIGNTRNHVMLVLGEENSLPIVCHLTFSGIKIETLKRVKDKVHLHYPDFTHQFRQALISAAKLSLSSEIKVTEEHLIMESDYACKYPIDSPVALKKTLVEFRKLLLATDSQQELPLVIKSCHQFVFDIIHKAAEKAQYTLPSSLQIPPRLAWSYIVNKLVYYDDKCCSIYIERQDVNSQQPIFFNNYNIKQTLPLKSENQSNNCCIL